ncbi:MAG: hypothetical protein Q6M04_11995 [Thermostichus sp. BF3_bins_97]
MNWRLTRHFSVLLSALTFWGSPTWAGEYFTEEVTSPSLEIIHGWRQEVYGITITITNTSLGSFQVPLEIDLDDRDSCERADLVLTNNRTMPMGSFQECILNIFPFLDKFINQEVSSIQVTLNGAAPLLEIPVEESDRLILAQVANQSREAFVFFQQELARVLELLKQSDPGESEIAQQPAAPAPTATPAESGANPGDFVIVGQIREERVGAGSRLSVEAINRSTRTVLNAQARFSFYQGQEVVDTRVAGFEPSDVPAGERAFANVLKTEANWDRVTVTFQWQ